MSNNLRTNKISGISLSTIDNTASLRMKTLRMEEYNIKDIQKRITDKLNKKESKKSNKPKNEVPKFLKKKKTIRSLLKKTVSSDGKTGWLDQEDPQKMAATHGKIGTSK